MDVNCKSFAVNSAKVLLAKLYRVLKRRLEDVISLIKLLKLKLMGFQVRELEGYHIVKCGFPSRKLSSVIKIEFGVDRNDYWLLMLFLALRILFYNYELLLLTVASSVCRDMEAIVMYWLSI